MLLNFNIEYQAQWGEQICVIGHTWSQANPLILQCKDGNKWQRSIHIPDFVNEISYRYALRRNDGSFLYEYGEDRYIFLNGAFKEHTLRDFWRNQSPEEAFMTRAFGHCLFRRERKSAQIEGRENLCFQIRMPKIEPEQSLGIMGNIPALGEWNADRILALDDTHYPVWKANLLLSEDCDIHYKYVIFNKKDHSIVDLEAGENRHLTFCSSQGRTICNDHAFRYSQTPWKAAGVVIPVFSLRSEEGFGIGEFMDLKLMADWAAATGMKMIQTLPINDTTLYHSRRDSYPYNAVSVFALNPIFLNIEKMGGLTPKKKEAYLAEKATLNALPIADYEQVAKAKEKYFKFLFKREKDQVLKSTAYLSFLQKNRDWLIPYALFCYLRDRFGTPNFRSWPLLSEYNEQEAAKMLEPTFVDADKIAYHLYLQFHLDQQLSEVHDYMHHIGVAFKGDIPIGISPDSVDAWTHPELFNLEASAGAPPDSFSLSGQNWGFPTYNWKVMAEDGFRWWRRRFSKMSDYFDAYRIDHILGFFRIWEIDKKDVWGLCGRFSPALPYRLEDLREAGIYLSEKDLTTPYIRLHILDELFGENSRQICDIFFDTDGDICRFKDAFDTQRKVKAYFKSKHAFSHLPEKQCSEILEHLYLLHSDVLFVRDLQHPELLHPRIALYESYHYKSLNEDLKAKLWQIHEDFFYHRHNEFWKESAMSKLPSLIEATDMLVCGEDLGMVPACVPEVMDTLNILSLEIQRMPKAMGCEFGDTRTLPYLSVCTTGTHDMNPLRAWWLEDREKTQRYYQQMLQHEGQAPETCTPELVREIIALHMQSPAMWTLLPLQDYLACSTETAHHDPMSERINEPVNNHNYWCYRMHIDLNKLIDNKDFTNIISSIISLRE